MSSVQRGPDDWLPRVFRRLPKHSPPAVSLDSILELGRKRARRRLFVGAGVVATAAILLTIALGGGTLEPPVHLDLKVVDVPSGAEDDTEVAAWFGLPDESR